MALDCAAPPRAHALAAISIIHHRRGYSPGYPYGRRDLFAADS